jgi:hypothetical protein
MNPAARERRLQGRRQLAGGAHARRLRDVGGCAGRAAEPLSGPWISDRVLCRFSFLTLRGHLLVGSHRRVFWVD